MLDKLIQQSDEYDDLKFDFGPTDAVRFDDRTANIVVHNDAGIFGGEVNFPMTDWAFAQVCQKLGKGAWPGTGRTLPKEYLTACPPWLRAEQLNHFAGIVNQQWLVRAYDNTCRAVLSDAYAIVGVTEALDITKRALDSSGASAVTVFKPVVTPDILHLKLIVRNVDTDDGKYGLGAYVTTGETGNRRLEVRPLLQRNSCTNSIIFSGGQAFSRSHIGNRYVLAQLFTAAVYDAIGGSVQSLKRLLHARNERLDDIGSFVDKLIKKAGWSVELKDSILVGTEGHTSLFGVVQGISSAANSVEDDTLRNDMQIYAGSLL
jgi:hypothetical protein